MPESGGSHRWKLAAVFAWLAVTLALAVWWLIFGLGQLTRISEVENESVRELARQHRMLMSEGLVLVLLLLGGGLSLVYYVWVEIRRGRQVREFFAAFTHDLKTSLASLRLQAESLEEDMQDQQTNPLLKRLIKDTVRVQLQLENSLYLAEPESSRLHMERISLEETVAHLRRHWPDLEIVLEREGVVEADSRALESVLKNLLHNAVVHGRASRVKIQVEAAPAADHIRVQLADNGQGFRGDSKRLGQPFERHGRTGGSGIGLYLARSLTMRMGGSVQFAPAPPDGGFTVAFELKGYLS